MFRSRPGWVGWAILGSLILANLAVEAVLAGADLRFWGRAWWRFAAFDLAGFRRTLLLGEPQAYAGQTVAMFVSHAFLHAGAGHLLGNMAALLALGPTVLRRVGPRAFLIVYFASAIAGAVAFALLADTTYPMVGASGAIFGLAGAEALSFPRQGRNGSRLTFVVIELVALNLILWLLTGGLVAWQAHLGGFLAGAALVRISGQGRGRFPGRG